jgi:hypothetical protein
MGVRENDFGGVCEIGADGVRLSTQTFIIPAINKDGKTTGGPTASDITPPVSDHVTAGEIDGVLAGGLQQHSRLRFVTDTGGRLFFVAHFNIIERQLIPELPVHRLNNFPPLKPSRNIRLVRCHNEQQSRLREPHQRFSDSWKNLEFRQRRRGKGLPVSYNRPVQHTVSIEKNCAPLLH